MTREMLNELVRYHAGKWQLGWSITDVAGDDWIEVRFGKAMPRGFDLSDPTAEGYWMAIRLDPRLAPYWDRELESAVSNMVENLVRFLKPHPALEQPDP